MKVNSERNDDVCNIWKQGLLKFGLNSSSNDGEKPIIVMKKVMKMSFEKKSNKNVIKMKKGVAICKQLCYNSGTYIREKE